jgi:hypothetical protein
MKRPRVGWHDPNFGIRFDETMAAIEEVVPPGAIDFAAESSLSVLSEPHLVRLRRNGFKAILPGIESWYGMGGKSKTGAAVGRAKVDQVSDHVNQILRYIPYVQTNFVLGLDSDEGGEPFELTKLPFPFHFLDNNQAMNVRPRHYRWSSLYDHIIDLRRHSFSARSVARRLGANHGFLTRSLNFVRAVSTEGLGRIRHDSTIRGLLDSDASVRRFFESETPSVPDFYRQRVRSDLGPLWSWLPPGALEHDPNAYLRSQAVVEAPAPGPAPSPGRGSREPRPGAYEM